jgi:diguanylate cyclase (GGDEF)-like protein
MSEKTNLIDTDVLDRLAMQSGLAVAVVDEQGRQVSVSNDNSICRNLNPTGEFSPQCARFCGRALEKAHEASRTIGFVCHAGLDCRAIPAMKAGSRFVAIVGRTFLKAENYRKATERAIIGDWRGYPPAEFFENILLTGSQTVLDKATKEVTELLSIAPATIVEEEPARHADASPPTEQSAAETPEKKTSDASAWRSFFGSILKNDHPRAVASILEFVGRQYGLTDLIWLEKHGDRLQASSDHGQLKDRRVRLGIATTNERLVDAFQNEMPLEISELTKLPEQPSRVLSIFPIGVDSEITAAIGVLDSIESAETKKHIARVCHSVAHQLEILRLRHEAAKRETLASAVRTFSESLRSIDSEDLWQNLTQKTAEILEAERASLLTFDERVGGFDIKALIGAKGTPAEEGEPGTRVARIVFAKREAVVVADVAKTGLKPAPAERGYKSASFMSCPINVGERTIGVMSFADRASGKAFDKGSFELFQAIAPQLAVAIDHAILREKAGEFEQLSVTDALTGLLNRRYIEARLSEEIKRSNRHGFPMSFMMLDVDHFKSYNDQFGHPAGDDALRTVGRVIRETLRGADVAARFGGEEFSILLPQTTGDEAVAIAERLRVNLEEAHFPHRRVTASIGVASCSAELCGSADLVSAADKALYEAKRLGRNRVLTFENLNGKAFAK